jgi:hydroxyethylthiazole kinase-like uncharacterized protein yjeF
MSPRPPQPIDPEVLKTWVKPRPRDCHKGDFGNVGIIGGAPGMAGAALLAARAALLLGAGRVYCALLDTRVAVDFPTPEIMIASPDTVLGLQPPACLVIGPGLGRSPAARQWLEAALASDLPLLVDADGLNLLAEDHDLRLKVRQRTAATLLTPHPGEAGRLLGVSGRAVQADRAGNLRHLVETYRADVVLKGADSLVQAVDGQVWQNGTGNPGMAAPGMGDVLAGMIAALAAQGLSLGQAALCGVYLHGAAGDRAVAKGSGPAGLTASEVAGMARRLFNAWASTDQPDASGPQKRSLM